MLKTQRVMPSTRLCLEWGAKEEMFRMTLFFFVFWSRCLHQSTLRQKKWLKFPSWTFFSICISFFSFVDEGVNYIRQGAQFSALHFPKATCQSHSAGSLWFLLRVSLLASRQTRNDVKCVASFSPEHFFQTAVFFFFSSWKNLGELDTQQADSLVCYSSQQHWHLFTFHRGGKCILQLDLYTAWVPLLCDSLSHINLCPTLFLVDSTNSVFFCVSLLSRLLSSCFSSPLAFTKRDKSATHILTVLLHHGTVAGMFRCGKQITKNCC